MFESKIQPRCMIQWFHQTSVLPFENKYIIACPLEAALYTMSLPIAKLNKKKSKLTIRYKNLLRCHKINFENIQSKIYIIYFIFPLIFSATYTNYFTNWLYDKLWSFARLFDSYKTSALDFVFYFFILVLVFFLVKESRRFFFVYIFI